MKKYLLLITPIIAMTSAAYAAISVDFNATSGWTNVGPGSLTHTIVADPNDAGNDVSQFDFTTSDLAFNVYDLGAGIANGASDSIEFRFYVGQTSGTSADHWFGLSDLSTADTWANSFGNMEAYFGFREDAVGSGTDSFDIFSRDGESGTSYDTNLAADTWHTMVISVNNSTDTYDLILNGSTLDSGLGFRNGTASNDLISFATFSNTNITSNVVLADSVVPEPSTYALFAGMLTLGLVIFRRRLSN